MPLPERMETGEKTSAKERAYDVLRRWIITGQLGPGEKISDKDIAAFLGLSRTPVREAIQVLQSQKLVEAVPGKATVVTDAALETCEEVYLPMTQLQKLAAQSCTDRIDYTALEELSDLNRVFYNRALENADPMDVLEADRAFHSKILDLAGNDYVKDFCDTLWIHSERMEYMHFQDLPTEQSVNEHRKIIDALEEGDEALAGRRMEEHWTRISGILKARGN